MAVSRYLLGSALVLLLIACGRETLPLGERAAEPGGSDSRAGASGASGNAGASGANGSGGATGASGGGGQSASGGSAGAGGNAGECQPTAEICYGNRPPTSPGNECLANIDNTGATRVQFRQTWVRDVAPIGLTLSFWHPQRAARTGLSLVECHSRGAGGEILISSWDRSNPDITRQTLTSGFASYVVTSPATPEVIDQGLCFADFSYRYSGPAEATDIAVDR
jgi:hypothetical protein